VRSVSAPRKLIDWQIPRLAVGCCYCCCCHNNAAAVNRCSFVGAVVVVVVAVVAVVVGGGGAVAVAVADADADADVVIQPPNFQLLLAAKHWIQAVMHQPVLL